MAMSVLHSTTGSRTPRPVRPPGPGTHEYREIEAMLNAMAACEGVTITEIVRRAVRERFLRRWPLQSRVAGE